ncbi:MULTISPECIES: hypothetical protein [Mycolicibacterium]|jgi:hypothetical protein|uniref:hypothetical protein n=1 Tax=Mycolicibacterium TaxID=1866885 RepID=UPI000A97EEE6|nr:MULTISPECIES: hypothetical protein [Mycolicibacterium]
MEPLSGRSWPDSPEEALANLIALVCAVGIGAGLVGLVGWFLWWWCFTNRPNAYRRRLEKESAEFRARWPQEQLGNAPYVSLSEEAQRCWALIFVLEDLDNSTKHSTDVERISKDISTLHHWVDAVVVALNAAADRESQAAVGRYSE